MNSYLIVCGAFVFTVLIISITCVIDSVITKRHEYRMKCPPKESRVAKIPSVKADPMTFTTNEWHCEVTSKPRHKPRRKPRTTNRKAKK